MRVSGFRSSLPFSGLIRQIEQDVGTVINVLQPGPLGIIEHKFSAKEIDEAKDTVLRAVANWKRNASLEERNIGLKDYIQK
ncbi:uncharacterized protein LOC129306783 [Prosopis cineraria]|uniref:uncharacterized protein LOC129306783 n=1 Tax=Prosopis cineraria TaxID=364024 RepID=UPI00241066B4|nr:uncharacterized protein LOC129306783 [Prosopis cineraria]